MDLKNFGKLKIVIVDGDADDGTIELRPDVGKLWKMILAIGYHDDDAASRILQWNIYDGTLLIGQVGESLAMGVEYPLIRTASTSSPSSTIGSPMYTLSDMYLSRDVYAQLVGTSLGAGKKLFIKALVIEYSGVG